MKVEILTLFPEMFKGPFSESMLKIAQAKGIVKIRVHDLRQWTDDRHRTADDKPFGGGSGMVMKVEPAYKALKELLGVRPDSGKRKSDETIILMTPQGETFDQGLAKKLSKMKSLILICGHYEGVDERIRALVDLEISIGDYVLTGGEIPACVVVDAITRLIPGVLGDPACLHTETFENGLLEYPQYTRPRVFEGMVVPEVVVSGDHKKIDEWRCLQAMKRTKEKRPDLYKKVLSNSKRRNK